MEFSIHRISREKNLQYSPPLPEHKAKRIHENPVLNNSFPIENQRITHESGADLSNL